jgi:hypothetical protein
MPKSKPEPAERSKRNPRDPAPEGPDRDKSWRPTDDGYSDEVDGTVDSEMELDTERYESSKRKK